MMPTYAAMRAGYGNMWKRAQLKPERRAAAETIAKRAIANKARYVAAASIAPGMPWWWVAAVHSLESGMRWNTHLHNGDPLTRRTTHVPAGRPAAGNPPFTWEESTRDALLLKGLDKVQSWEIERCLYEWERYNGFGYLPRGVNSPYLWSFTTLQQPGKYVADGVFDRSAVSQQCGAVAVAKAIFEIEGDAMAKLQETVQEAGIIAPTLIRMLAGAGAQLAVRALAEALENKAPPAVSEEMKAASEVGKKPDPERVNDLLESLPLSIFKAVLAEAEEFVGDLVGAVDAPVPAVEPTIVQPRAEEGPTVVVQPQTVEVPVPVQTAPETWLDRILPAGLKTPLGILVYVAGSVLVTLGVLDAATGEAISQVGLGIIGIGLAAKIDRVLPVLEFFLKLRRPSAPVVTPVNISKG